MFFYLYDSFVLDKNYTNILNQIESRVIELGINGRVEKLTPLRNMKELLEQGMANEAHTIVVVGNDNTFIRALNVVAAHSVVLGYIPMENNSVIGTLCGITTPLEACNILSRRITKTIPLLKVNQNYALLNLNATLPTQTTIRCNDAFTLSTITSSTAFNVSTGALGCELTLQPQPMQTSWLQLSRRLGKKPSFQSTSCRATKITLQCPEQSIPVLLDQTITIKTPITIQLKPKALKLIVGKGRTI